MVASVAISPYKFLTEEELHALITDPACTWRWALALPDINGVIEQPYSTGEGGAAIQDPAPRVGVKTPVGLAMTVEFPPNDIGVETRFGGATAISVVRHNFTSDVSVTFYETYDYVMTRYLTGWQQMITDADQKGLNNFGLPAEYKKDIVFFGFDITSNTRSLLQVLLTECFPKPQGGLSYGSDNGIITVSAEFAVDGSLYGFTDSPPPPLTAAQRANNLRNNAALMDVG